MPRTLAASAKLCHPLAAVGGCLMLNAAACGRNAPELRPPSAAGSEAAPASDAQLMPGDCLQCTAPTVEALDTEPDAPGASGARLACELGQSPTWAALGNGILLPGASPARLASLGGNGLLVTEVNVDGTLGEQLFHNIEQSGRNLQAAALDDGWVIAWAADTHRDAFELRIARLDRSGALSAPPSVLATGQGAVSFALAVSHEGGAALFWSASTVQQTMLQFAHADASGSRLDSVQTLHTLAPDLRLETTGLTQLGTGYVASFNYHPQLDLTASTGAYLQRLDEHGFMQEEPLQLGAYTRDAALLGRDADVLLAWVQDPRAGERVTRSPLRVARLDAGLRCVNAELAIPFSDASSELNLRLVSAVHWVQSASQVGLVWSDAAAQTDTATLHFAALDPTGLWPVSQVLSWPVQRKNRQENGHAVATGSWSNGEVTVLSKVDIHGGYAADLSKVRCSP